MREGMNAMRDLRYWRPVIGYRRPSGGGEGTAGVGDVPDDAGMRGFRLGRPVTAGEYRAPETREKQRANFRDCRYR